MTNMRGTDDQRRGRCSVFAEETVEGLQRRLQRPKLDSSGPLKGAFGPRRVSLYGEQQTFATIEEVSCGTGCHREQVVAPYT